MIQAPCRLRNAGVMRNLSTISADAEQLSAMVHGALLEPFWAATCASDAGVWFDARPWLGQPMLFWKEALKTLCHRMGVGLVKEKAVGELLLRLTRCALQRLSPEASPTTESAARTGRATATAGCR